MGKAKHMSKSKLSVQSKHHQNHSSKELYILVIAHPDDESMFFLPTLVALCQTAIVWIVCLTTGNYNGLGAARVKELEQVAALLGIHKLCILNDLVDHPTQRWVILHATTCIKERLWEQEKIAEKYTNIVFLTFDYKGVSGHVNHMDTCAAVQQLAAQENLECWSLQTVSNPIVKYLPIGEWMRLLISFAGLDTNRSISSTTNATVHVYKLYDPCLNWKAMATHQSQFVWYRRLFVIFSCYSYVNVWNKCECEKND
jgi:N-acetylglucosaminylphosphatidylinositol deacetylase